MKTKVLVLAVFLLGLLALAVAGQTAAFKRVGPIPVATASKTITIAGSGNQIVILRGDLEAAKAAATTAGSATTIVVPASARTSSGGATAATLGASGTVASAMASSPR